MSRPRRIVIDGVPYRYSRRHGHVAGQAGPRLCEEVLRAWPEDRSQGTLVLRFRDKQGGATLAGGGWGGHDGALLIDDKHVNLNLPRVVAALLQAARQFLQPPPRQTMEFDGFGLWRMRSREEP